DQAKIGYFSTKLFSCTYCVTTFKSQGKTYEEDYNICDLNKMNLLEVYTALSRGRDINKIHFDYTPITFKMPTESIYPTPMTCTPLKQGEIYELHNPVVNKYYI